MAMGAKAWGALLAAGLAVPGAAQQTVSTAGQGDVAVTIYTGEIDSRMLGRLTSRAGL